MACLFSASITLFFFYYGAHFSINENTCVCLQLISHSGIIFRVDYNVLLTAEHSFSNCENDGRAFPDFLVSITFT